MPRQPVYVFVVCAAMSIAALAQSESQDKIRVEPMDKTPVFRVNVVERNVKAVNYRHRGGSTNVDLRGTELALEAQGKARVDSRTGRTDIQAKVNNLQPANKFGMEYLTYVMWAVSPEGRAKNLGELVLDDGKSELHATTDLQTFGLIVTAEPHFGVTQPSDVVVMENVVRDDTKGAEQAINTRYELLPRGLYASTNEPIRDVVYGVDKKAPNDLFQARNAIRIARAAQADRYAPESFGKAKRALDQAEDYYRRKQSRTAIATAAREAAQTAEESRVMAIKRQQEEQAQAERRAAAERAAQAQAQEAEARAKAEAESARRLEAEGERTRAEQAKADAERARQESELAAQRAQQEREQAEAAKAAALAQQQASQTEAERARLMAQQAEQARLKAEQDREEMRERLRAQLNQVLETKDSARGLIVNMSDVLFDTAKATLKPGAQVRLAKVAGIILAYPDLKLQIEGHTDSVGGDEYNQRLSEQRAAVVRDFLVKQGVPAATVAAMGFGKTQPIASNATPAGRQLNRRVELVVSGEAIGTRMGAPQPGATPSAGSASGGTAGAAAGAGRDPSTPPPASAPVGTQPQPR
jgi:outer membrane protein OmpA-like peptidoglycan-associated protein